MLLAQICTNDHCYRNRLSGSSSPSLRKQAAAVSAASWFLYTQWNALFRSHRFFQGLLCVRSYFQISHRVVLAVAAEVGGRHALCQLVHLRGAHDTRVRAVAGAGGRRARRYQRLPVPPHLQGPDFGFNEQARFVWSCGQDHTKTEMVTLPDIWSMSLEEGGNGRHPQRLPVPPHLQRGKVS